MLHCVIRLSHVTLFDSFICQFYYTVNHRKGGSTLAIITLEYRDGF